ncbi:MAG: ribonuclease Y [candidate division Zixibacteria bacterium]|nr:ribonuclease Y [candidate division Zixibacteria bacterium]
MNPDMVLLIVEMIVVGVVAFIIAWFLAHRTSKDKISHAAKEAERLVAEAKKESEIRQKEVRLEAREELMKLKSDFEKESDAVRRELEAGEKNLKEESSSFHKKLDLFEIREKEFNRHEKSIQAREKKVGFRETELDEIIIRQNEQLQKIAQMTPEDAKKQLMDNMLSAAKVDAARYIKEIKDKAEADADKEAKEIILSAIYRCAADHTVETTVSVVNLPTDEMKGRIIGREGRNIRSFETATGIDVIVDDTPEAVILSGYDPVRREIARMSLDKLITDGRIHPTRIEEVVDKSKREMEVIVREAGEQACFELGIHNLHPDVVSQLGKLNFRTSYGQNVLLHSKEVSMLCGLMAAELNLDAQLAKSCGLLHDIGKAIDRETEGTHTQIGADFVRRYGMSEEIINAVESHHGDVPMLGPYPVLVQAADAVSGARPGARRESLEAYIKRLQQIEELADSFKGVSKSYAIQAGREVRVIVEHETLDDLASSILASDLATKIENELQYPGQIMVTVVREMRSTEFAK